MSETVKILVLCALVLPVIGALLARSKNPRLAWIARAISALGRFASALLGLTVVLVLILIAYLAWQFSK